MPQIQPPVPLSASRLWSLQRESYTAQGPAAWRAGGLPLQILSNPFVAMAYARVCHGARLDAAQNGELVTILELGAGSGRFAFHLLRALEALGSQTEAPLAPFRMVMTDLAPSNIEAWVQHAQLAPFVARGVLDFAVFDLDDPKPLDVRVGGQQLASWRGPLVVVANYVFDSIPRDAWRVESGRLGACHLSLHSNDGSDGLGEVTWRQSVVDVPTDALRETVFGALVARYMEGLDHGVFTLPTVAVRCLDWLNDACEGPMVLLASDKGDTEMAHMEGRRGLSVARHGEDAVSMMVNFDALDHWAVSRGGQSRFAPHQDNGLVTQMVILNGAETAHTKAGWCVGFEGFGPVDCQWLMSATARDTPSPTPHHVLALLRLSRWDPRQLTRFSSALVRHAAEIQGPLRRDFVDALGRVWDNVFVLEGQEDTAFVIAQIVQSWGLYKDAVRFYTHALEQHGPHPSVHFNRATCHAELQQFQPALDDLAMTLSLSPGHPGADALAARLARG